MKDVNFQQFFVVVKTTERRKNQRFTLLFMYFITVNKYRFWISLSVHKHTNNRYRYKKINQHWTAITVQLIITSEAHLTTAGTTRHLAFIQCLLNDFRRDLDLSVFLGWIVCGRERNRVTPDVPQRTGVSVTTPDLTEAHDPRDSREEQADVLL